MDPGEYHGIHRKINVKPHDPEKMRKKKDISQFSWKKPFPYLRRKYIFDAANNQQLINREAQANKVYYDRMGENHDAQAFAYGYLPKEVFLYDDLELEMQRRQDKEIAATAMGDYIHGDNYDGQFFKPNSMKSHSQGSREHQGARKRAYQVISDNNLNMRYEDHNKRRVGKLGEERPVLAAVNDYKEGDAAINGLRNYTADEFEEQQIWGVSEKRNWKPRHSDADQLFGEVIADQDTANIILDLGEEDAGGGGMGA